MHSSQLEGCRIAQISWPEHALIVAVRRGTGEILPRGATRLMASDTLMVMVDVECEGEVNDRISELCAEQPGSQPPPAR